MSSQKPPTRTGVKLDFKGGGWVLVLALVLSVFAAWWRLAVIVPSLNQPAIGDGRTVESYGFDLSNCTLDPNLLRPYAQPKNAVPVLVNPPTLTPAQYDMMRLGRSTFLVSSDPVVCVEVGGAARCYPVRLMIWHEVVNDTLGGVPIAVAYNALSGSAVAYDRRAAGETLELRVSGLFYDSNPLLYDRRADGKGESLWSQFTGRAVAGPAAGREEALRRIPVALTHWSDWRAAHPETTVLKPQKDRMRVYKSEPYSQYATDDDLEFPAAPMPLGGPALKAPCIGVRIGETWHVFEVAKLAQSADANGRAARSIGGAVVSFVCCASPPAARVASVEGAEDWSVAYAYWFMWYASGMTSVE